METSFGMRGYPVSAKSYILYSSVEATGSEMKRPFLLLAAAFLVLHGAIMCRLITA